VDWEAAGKNVGLLGSEHHPDHHGCDNDNRQPAGVILAEQGGQAGKHAGLVPGRTSILPPPRSVQYTTPTSRSLADDAIASADPSAWPAVDVRR
jgi:hypothetical protein